jgi:hypothetical protein
MIIKIGVLAAAAALSLAIPAAAMAQPVYGHGFAVREDIRRDDGRRFDRGLELRRLEDLRRLRWERDHDYRFGHRAYR